ncbi:RICIN domain-containing protein [Acidobacteriota bacterium]
MKEYFSNPLRASMVLGLVFFAFVVTGQKSFAWKGKTHIYLAQQAVNDALDDGKVTIYELTPGNDGSEPARKKIGDYPVSSATLKVLSTFPNQFRAGAIGPDGYPDLLTGQQLVHPYPYTHNYLQYLWSKTRNSGGPERAFVLGFMAHAAGDMYGHSFINHYAGGPFELNDIFVRHFIVESYIDKCLPPITEALGENVYTIQQKSNGRYIDAWQSKKKDYTVVTRTHQNDDTQQWILNRVSHNTYTIQQRSSGRYLDAWPSKKKDYTIVTRTHQNDDTQKWILTQVGNNEYTIQQKSSDRYVDAHEVPQKDYALVTRTQQNDNTQKWILNRLQGKTLNVDLKKQVSIDGVESFMYSYMVNAPPGSELRSLLANKTGSDTCVPLLFSDLKADLQRRIPKCKPLDMTCSKLFMKEWVKDIDRGLKAWPRYNHRIAVALLDSETGAAADAAEEYVLKHFLSMAGNPDFANVSLKFINDILESIGFLAEPIRQLKKDLLNYLLKEALGMTTDELKEFATQPAKQWLTHLAQEDLNKFNREELKTQRNYQPFKYEDFAAAYNTVTMIKLSFLDRNQINKLLMDLGDNHRLQEENILLTGHLTTLDGDNKWILAGEKWEPPRQCLPVYKRMVLARNFSTYRKLFKPQTGDAHTKFGNVTKAFQKLCEESGVQADDLSDVAVTPGSFGKNTITTKSNGLCLTVKDNVQKAGQPAILWQCVGRPNQAWTMKQDGTIRGFNDSGFCLDAFKANRPSGPRAGDKVGIWHCNGGPNQQWRVEGSLIKGIGDMCLDVSGGFLKDGSEIILWGCHGKPNQQWRVTGGGPAVSTTQLRGTYTIQQKSNGRYVDAHEVSQKDYMLVTRTKQNNDTQKWILTPLGGNVYTIQQKSNGRCVDAHGGANRDYAAVTRHGGATSENRKWILTHLGGNEYTIQQKGTGRYLDAHEVQQRDYKIVTRTRQNNDTQRWILKPVR